MTSSIIGEDCRDAWVQACKHLLAHGDSANLLVTVLRPNDETAWNTPAIDAFCRSHGLKTPRQVAYTIFPASRAKSMDGMNLYQAYNAPNGVFARLRRKWPQQTRWGTYFRRLTNYETANGRIVNQLERIIAAINSRANCYKAAYTMLVPKPGSENVLPRGGPCLHYLALQIETGSPRRIGLLAVYRNHDFLERAYGNYVGLAQLLKFICDQTGSELGHLVCLSSRAFVSAKRTELRKLADSLSQ